MNAAELHQALTATGQYIVQLGRTAADPADEEGLHAVIIDGTFDLHTLAAALTAEHTTPEGVRALIERVHLATSDDPNERSIYDDFLRELSDALEATLPREDADLDAIEAQHVEAIMYADDVAEGKDEEVPDDYERHYCEWDGEDWPCRTVLLARVRTAEAERDEAREERDALRAIHAEVKGLVLYLAEGGRLDDFALDELMSPLDGDEPTDDTGTSVSHLWMQKHDDEVRAAALASRAVETAEEWEYGIQHARATHGRAFTLEEQAAREMVASTTPGRIRLVRRPRLPWEPVPPTPETEEQP